MELVQKRIKYAGFFTFFVATFSASAIEVTPNAPLKIDNRSGVNKLYLASSAYAGNIYPGFTKTNFSNISSTADVTLNVSGLGNSTTHVHLFADTNGSSQVYVPLRSNDGTLGTALAVGGYQSVSTSSGSVSLRINLALICEDSQTRSLNVSGCDSSTGLPYETSGAGVAGVTLSLVTATSEISAVSGGTSAYSMTVVPQSTAPALVCPDTKPMFFPSDESILIENGRFSATAASGGGASAFQYFVAFGVENATTTTGSIPADPFDSEVLARADWGTSQITLSGFRNSTADSQYFYEAAYSVVDYAGIPSPVTVACTDTKVFASEIAGLLKESNCFVATVTYGSGKHFLVKTLREFRDQILGKFSLGRSFVSYYYQYGPKAALWIQGRPHLIPFARVILAPIAALAFVVLHPEILFLLVGFLVGFKFARLLNRKRINKLYSIFLFLGLFSNALAQSEYSESSSYSAQLKKKLAQPSVPESFIETEKKKILESQHGLPSSEGYSQKLQKVLKKEPASESYSEAERQKIPPKERTGAIADFHSSKKLEANYGSEPLKGRFALRFGASSRQDLAATSSGANEYSSIYSAQWAPDLAFSYERRILRDFLSVYTSAGLTVSRGTALLSYIDSRFGSTSQQKTNLIMSPIQVGPMLRLPISRYFTPFVGAGPGALLAYETRSDRKGTKKGYTFATWVYTGLEISLDGSPDAKWDRYSSLGTRELALSLGYSYFNLLDGGLLSGSLSGPQLGFQFSF